MGKFVDLTGKRFGMLTVLSQADKNKCNHIVWLCKCDCGNTSLVESGVPEPTIYYRVKIGLSGEDVIRM